MRVLVVLDSVAALSSAEAGAQVAAAWAERGAQVVVVPAGDAGGGFVRAFADQHTVPLEVHAEPDAVVTSGATSAVGLVRVEGAAPSDGLPLDRSSAPLGAAVAALMDGRRPSRILVDLSGPPVHDGGAGFLAALGATADRPLTEGVEALSGLTRLDLEPVRERLAGVELVGVVPADERERLLLGLRGITSLRGRDAGLDAEVLLRVDAALASLAAQAAPDAAQTPGAGACGGVGLAVLALGGELRTGPSVALDAVTGARADLVLTGCSVFDFGSRGGGVVAAAAAYAAGLLAPCVVLAGEVLIGSREMRTMGIEAAYAVRESSLDRPVGAVEAEELAATARRVARSWSW